MSPTKTLIINSNKHLIEGEHGGIIQFLESKPSDRLSISIDIYKIDGKSEIPEWILSSTEVFGFNVRALYRYPPFRESLISFSKEIFGEDKVDFDKLDEVYQKNRSHIASFIQLANEQRKYLKTVESDCDSYVIAVKINDQPYGAVFAFTNNYTDDLMIQGISKFIVPGMFSLLRPEENKILPSLNSILMPEVEKLAKQLRCRRIIVAPLEKQGEIIQKHYGFYPIESIEYPCKDILRAWGETPYFAKDVA